MALCVLLLLLPLCGAQQPGTLKSEGNPTMAVKECTKAGGCTTKEHKLVLDANWRWIHTTEGSKNCYTGNKWDSSICTDPDTCAQGCALEAVDAGQYESIYGITAVPGGVRLNFVTGSNVGSRVFLLEDDETYKLFKLKNREFAVDVDSSTVECGMNGAMYFIEMAADGGKGRGYNAAGAKYGTGYCDAQCPHDVKFIGGKANSKDWKPHPKDFSNSMGLGHYGACCAEMDIWEANNMATAYTPHPCNIDTPGQYTCEGTECGDNDSGERYDGLCDKDGCDINPFRNGNATFYGKGASFAVDSARPMTVVTQFLTADGTDDGDLSEIRRFYVQDGRAISSPSIMTLPKTPDSITDEMCSDMKDLFQNENDFEEKGGNKAMGESLERGHVAAFSLWDDIDVHMMWLDSCYPEDRPCSGPGVHRGMCPGGEESSPQNVRSKHPQGYVTFANAAVGEIGSTQPVYPGTPMTSLPPATTVATTSSTTSVPSTTTAMTSQTAPVTSTQPASCAGAWQQCGGRNHAGPTCCTEGYRCIVGNEWHSQCKPVTSTTTSSATVVPSTTTAMTSQTAPVTSTQPASCAGAWQQCGGRNHAGPTCCTEGYRCIVGNEWYSQCKPAETALAQAAPQKSNSRRHKFLGPSFLQSKAKTEKTAASSQFEEHEL